MCDTFWGSHGCDLTEGHEGVHVCGHPDEPVVVDHGFVIGGACSEFETTGEMVSEYGPMLVGQVRYALWEDDVTQVGWSEWHDSEGWKWNR